MDYVVRGTGQSIYITKRILDMNTWAVKAQTKTREVGSVGEDYMMVNLWDHQ